MRLPGIQKSVHLLSRQSQGVFHLHSGMHIVLKRLLFFGNGLFPSGGHFFGSVEGIIGMTGFDQLFGKLAILYLSFALAIGPIGPFFTWSFIGVYPRPIQAFHHIILGAFHEPVLIRVFDSEDKDALVLTGKK